MDIGRRQLLALVGGGALVGGYSTLGGSRLPRPTNGSSPGPRPSSTSSRAPPPTSASLTRLGHVGLSASGHVAEGAVSPDGRYVAVGTIDGNGTYLLDLRDAESPSQVHHLPSNREDIHERDVKFDPRGGLYYRTQEPVDDGGGGQGFDRSGVEVVDVGYGDASPGSPAVVGRVGSPDSHNLFPHPDVPVLYVVNNRPGGKGLDVVDVTDPAAPRRVGSFWSRGAFHDVVVDPERKLIHGAASLGYAVLDCSDPRTPREVGWFDYGDHADYAEIGTAGFEMGHYADYDPERGLAVVGDEVGSGVPGGKHVFDVGWGEGSPSDPRHVGFTHSPNAESREEDEQALWTTHNHDVVPTAAGTYLVSGDYSDGVVLYDISDPTDPHPVDRYVTDEGADGIDGGDRAPWAWGANYHAGRDLVFATDQVTGAYTFELTLE